MADAEATENALTRFWRDPTPVRARAYLTALLPVLRRSRKAEGKARSANGADDPGDWIGPDQVGPYVLGDVLGAGAEGMVFRARSADGTEVALKLSARGDALIGEVFGQDWPEHLVRTYEAGMYEGVSWAARELASETLHDYMLSAAPLNIDQVLDVFSIACRGVAALHQHRTYGWSAHSKNVYRVGDQWKIGDFGRVWCFVDCVDQRQRDLYAVMGFDDDQGAVGADDPFGHWTGTGFLPYDAERERRLRLDDCAMLGGLLVEMLTAKRWEWFFRALNKRPYCSAVYPLTGVKETDVPLSAILNRAWRGDAGGGPLIANRGRGELSVYDDVLSLLADVSSVLGVGTRKTVTSEA